MKKAYKRIVCKLLGHRWWPWKYFEASGLEAMQCYRCGKLMVTPSSITKALERNLQFVNQVLSDYYADFCKKNMEGQMETVNIEVDYSYELYKQGILTFDELIVRLLKQMTEERRLKIFKKFCTEMLEENGSEKGV